MIELIFVAFVIVVFSMIVDSLSEKWNLILFVLLLLGMLIAGIVYWKMPG